MTLPDLVRSKGLNWVSSRGDPKSPVWLVGEAPGEKEDSLGFAFVGASGDEQNRMLGEAGFAQRDVYFTNPYAVRPPNNDMTRFAELGVPKELFQEHFLAEIRQYQPPIIICVGETSTQFLCPDTLRLCEPKKGYIHKWMGSLLRSPFLGWEHYLMPNLHPAYVLRNWGERQISVLFHNRAYEEWQYLKRHGTLQPLPRRDIKSNLADEEVLAYLRGIPNHSCVAVDIEMIKRGKVWVLPHIISYACSPSDAVAFMMWPASRTGPAIMREQDRILRNCHLIGQNCLQFDWSWLNSIGYYCNIAATEDIRVMHHVRWPELPHSLAFMAQQYTRQPFWKDEGKSYSVADRTAYCGMDGAVTFECYLELLKDMNVSTL